MRPGFRSSVLLLCLPLLAEASRADSGTSGEEDVVRWLETNEGLTTLKVEFTQTRRLVSLKNPIRQKGVLWLDHPSNRFRWQTGNPPKTIVVREGKELLIIRPPTAESSNGGRQAEEEVPAGPSSPGAFPAPCPTSARSTVSAR